MVSQTILSVQVVFAVSPQKVEVVVEILPKGFPNKTFESFRGQKYSSPTPWQTLFFELGGGMHRLSSINLPPYPLPPTEMRNLVNLPPTPPLYIKTSPATSPSLATSLASLVKAASR